MTEENRSVKFTYRVFFFGSFQESISDFYWYYSGKDVMDEAGQRNFSKALAVAKQIFNSLTEYIQVTACSVLCSMWLVAQSWLAGNQKVASSIPGSS